MKKIIITLLLAPFTSNLFAQQTFIAKGKIEYEKRVNIYKELEFMSDGEESRSWIETLKKISPEVSVTYFDLYFNDDKTLFEPGRTVEVIKKAPEWVLGPAFDNVIYNNFSQQQTVSQKHVYDNTFLIQDSLRKIEWRITNDTRTIAGFECRKAVGRMLDSVYVIAFYTDQILTTGGPESFTGLPGMILGAAIPRINTTWFATKLELTPVTPEQVAPPKKGKKVNNKTLLEELKPVMKDWGKEGKRNIWLIMI